MGNKNNFTYQSKIVTILSIVLLYIYIYNPPFAFLPFTPIKFFYFGIILFLNKKIAYIFFKNFKIQLFIFFCIILYSFFRGAFAGEYDILYTDIITLVECFLVGYLINYIIINYTNISFLNLILIVSGIASVITLFLIVNPEINDYVKNDLFVTTEFTRFLRFRSFGFSEGLTFAYGITQGLAVCFCLYFLKEYKFLLLLLPLHLIAIAFNARIGFMPVLLLIVYIIFTGKKIKNLLIITLVLLLLFFSLFSLQTFQNYQETIDWTLKFFTEINDFFSGNVQTGNMDVMINNMIVIPDTSFEVIFGRGKDIFRDSYNNSDIGYIIQLNYGGLIYISLFLLLLIYMTHTLYKTGKKNMWFAFLFLTVILIANIKGNGFVTSPSLRLLMIIYFYVILSNKTKQIINYEGFNNKS